MPATVSLSRLAWRNLWRNRRRTLLNLFGISFGVLFAVVVTGLSDATYGDMIDYAAKMGVGHVSVEHEEYREAPSFEHVPRIDAAKIDTLRQDPRVTRITRRISGGTLAASPSGNQGASLMAIDPLAEGDETLLFLHDLKEGALFDTSEATTAAVGATLAENLGVRIGNKIVVTMTDKTGSVVSGMFRVGGLISTGAPSIDGGLVVTPLATTQALLGYDADEVTTVAIYLEDHRDAEAVARDLRVHLPAAAVALDWKRAQP
ncbi:MAG: ABC transporter permease, partial [Nannocystaceae bacterium]